MHAGCGPAAPPEETPSVSHILNNILKELWKALFSLFLHICAWGFDGKLNRYVWGWFYVSQLKSLHFLFSLRCHCLLYVSSITCTFLCLNVLSKENKLPVNSAHGKKGFLFGQFWVETTDWVTRLENLTVSLRFKNANTDSERWKISAISRLP